MKKTILIIIFLLMLINFNIVRMVEGSGNYIIMSDWDDIGSGSDWGISGFFNFTNISTCGDDMFEVSSDISQSGSNSFKLFHDNTDIGAVGYWNLTTTFDYIYSINFSFYNDIQSTPYLYMRFYNDDDTKVMDLRITNTYIYFLTDGGYSEVWDSIVADTWYYININHNSINLFDISIYDSATHSLQSAVQLNSCDTDTWTNFTYIYFSFLGGPIADALYYIDDVYISLTPNIFTLESGLGSRCANSIWGYEPLEEIQYEGSSVDWTCVLFSNINNVGDCISGSWSWTPAQYVEHKTDGFYNERIRHILLPIGYDQRLSVSDTLSDYKALINEHYVGIADYIVSYDNEYALVWENVNITVNGQIVFAFSCDSQTTGLSKNYYWYSIAGFYGGRGLTKVHNDLNSFYDGVFSGSYMGNFKLSVCWYYDTSSLYNDTDPDKIPTINEFDDYFGSGDTGEGYVEFLGWNTECYYYTGDTPTIVYNLTGFGGGNGTKRYGYYIYRVVNGTTDEIVYSDFIEVVNRDYFRDVVELHNFDFENSGSFYIMVYNTSDYGSTWENFIHRSLTIQVCKTPGVYRPDETTTYYGLPYWVPWIIGIFITLFVTMSPLIIALYITRNNRHKELPKIPGLVYVGFFYMGLIICVLMDLLPSWLPFVILFGMVVFFAVTWYYGKKSSIAEAE